MVESIEKELSKKYNKKFIKIKLNRQMIYI